MSPILEDFGGLLILITLAHAQIIEDLLIMNTYDPYDV